MWDHLLRMGQKAEAVRHARSAPVRLYTDFPYNKPNHWLVSAIAVDPANSGNVIAFNLAHDPAELLSVDDDCAEEVGGDQAQAASNHQGERQSDPPRPRHGAGIAPIS